MIGEGEDPAGLDGAARLLSGFLASHGERTRQAYTIDVDDFTRTIGGRSAPAAVATLLAGGVAGARRLALDFAVDLRARGLSEATITRRLATMRSLVGTARQLGLIDWALDVPSPEQVAAAVRDRGEGASYLLPRHPGEIDRLDVQHYAMQATVGADYLAPVGGAARVLDTGCGTGQWGFDVCRRLPDAVVVGFDLVAGKPDPPPHYHFVRGSLLEGLPFQEGHFDLVHQRFLIVGLPLAAWPGVVGELARVARPGGWVELVEPRMPTGPGLAATARLIDLATTMAASLGLDTTYQVHATLHEYLERAGLANVVRRDFTVPVGRWAGEVGSLMATDMRAAFSRLCEVMQSVGTLGAAESHQLVQRAQEEWEEHRATWSVAVAYGRKP